MISKKKLKRKRRKSLNELHYRIVQCAKITISLDYKGRYVVSVGADVKKRLSGAKKALKYFEKTCEEFSETSYDVEWREERTVMGNGDVIYNVDPKTKVILKP